MSFSGSNPPGISSLTPVAPRDVARAVAVSQRLSHSIQAASTPGKECARAFIGQDFILGALGQHWWCYASAESGRDDVDLSWLNLFYFLNLEDGWQIGGTPMITADWESDSDDRWSVPIGLGDYKTHSFGKMPVKLGVETQYHPISPDTLGEEVNIRFVIAPIIPSLF